MERAVIARRMMNQMQTIALHDKLKGICSTVNGKAIYIEGYSDERVHKEIGETAYSINSIINLRRVMFGDLPKKAKVPSIPDLLARIEALEAWAAARPVASFVKDD
jgi:hypothetical protein